MDCGRFITKTPVLEEVQLLHAGCSRAASTANMPRLKGKEISKGPVVHIAVGRSNALEDPDAKKFADLEGGKSTVDMVYLSVEAGKEVS